MATQLLAAGTTAAASTDFTLAAGESATLLLKGSTGLATAPTSAHVVVQAQDSAGAWRHHHTMRGTEGSCVVTAVGTFRCFRPAQANPVGVDRG